MVRTIFIAAALAAVSISAGASETRTLTEVERASHALNRLAYGPRPGDIERVAEIGVERWIATQLDPQSIALPAALEALDTRGTNGMTRAQLYLAYGPTRANLQRDGPNDPEALMKVIQRARAVIDDAASARVTRALASPRQLEEMMAEFWFNHFNIFFGRVLVRPWVGSYERDAIRPHVLGRFRDLLGATARHPAMLAYLDNWRSAAPGVTVGQGAQRSTGLNENYARELMELHTLGVDGGYTQKDVIELARVLTGWTIDPQLLAGRAEGEGFAFIASRHDNGPKVLFGEPVPGSGRAQGEWALDRLAAHPSTARYISTKLARWFVADSPPPALVDKLAARFTSSGGEIKAVLAELFASAEFWDPRHVGRQFKTPYHYVVSSLRATDVTPADLRPVYGQLAQMGMPIYGCPTPDGFATVEAVWLNADAISRRIDFAAIVGAGRLPGVQPAEADRVRSAMGPKLRTQTAETVGATAGQMHAMLLLGSPDFMRR
jgi:uncharacterized protein (DUF1800 family)